jgi:class 3 adenylate cyclase
MPESPEKDGKRTRFKHAYRSMMELRSDNASLSAEVKDLKAKLATRSATNVAAEPGFLNGNSKNGKSGGESPPSSEPSLSRQTSSQKVQLDYRKLAPFIPGIVLRKIVKHKHNLSEAYEENLNSAVFFADMSGFTALTEKLAAHTDGAELMCNALNGFFTKLLEVVRLWGGDCVKFAGDALMILWPTFHADSLEDAKVTGPKTIEQAVWRAVQCSHMTHKILIGYPPVAGVDLTLHCGLGVGPLKFLVLGGKRNRFEVTVAGEPIHHQLAIAEPAAGPGQTVMSPRAWEIVSAMGATGRELACPAEAEAPGFWLHEGFTADALVEPPPWDPTQVLPITQEHIQAMSVLLPRPVYLKMRQGSDTLSEMELVTVLFFKVVGIDLVGPLEESQRMLYNIQEAVYQYEGSINKLLVDEKGTLIVCAFGMLPSVHHDDPVRGIAAAFLVRHQLQQMGATCHTGITTGRVFCGIVGSDFRREYTVMGDPVNLAARLMCKAKPDEILIDEWTHAMAQLEVRCTKLPKIRVKGKTVEIQPFRPTAFKTHSQMQLQAMARSEGIDEGDFGSAGSPEISETEIFIGRQEEASRIEKMLQKMALGEASVLMVTGSTGIGTSAISDNYLTEGFLDHLQESVMVTTAKSEAAPVAENPFSKANYSKEKKATFAAGPAGQRQPLLILKVAKDAHGGGDLYHDGLIAQMCIFSGFRGLLAKLLHLSKMRNEGVSLHKVL